MRPPGRRCFATWALLGLATVLLAGCGLSSPRSPAAAAPITGSTALVGTRWALRAIQSMDDAQGTTRVDDARPITLELGTDGMARFRLDCNRGSSSYQVTPAAVDSGQITFGALVTTRALCAPPRLDERVARDMGYVRSYRLKDGRLFLSLMADGGIYEWQPLPD